MFAKSEVSRGSVIWYPGPYLSPSLPSYSPLPPHALVVIVTMQPRLEVPHRSHEQPDPTVRPGAIPHHIGMGPWTIHLGEGHHPKANRRQ